LIEGKRQASTLEFLVGFRSQLVAELTALANTSDEVVQINAEPVTSECFFRV
jgi:hypothetical protein